VAESFDQQEARSIAEFSHHFHIQFNDPELLRLALTHRSYLSVTGMGPRESNERLEFLGDSVLGLVTSEYLYRHHPDEHEGQLTKTKSLLVSKAILSRRALHMGLGRFILLSHAEMESGGRKRASILADAFESVLGAVYLDQGFEAARRFVIEHLLRGSSEIVADKRHRNYKSQLQEYVQSTFHTHPVYRIRSQVGPDHSKLFLVEVMVGRRVLGAGRGSNKKEAEQAAARDAMEQVAANGGGRRSEERHEVAPRAEAPRSEDHGRGEPRGLQAPPAPAHEASPPDEGDGERRRSRRGGRGRRRARPDSPMSGEPAQTPVAPGPPEEGEEPKLEEIEPYAGRFDEDDLEEIGRPEEPYRLVGASGDESASAVESEVGDAHEPWDEPTHPEDDEDAGSHQEDAWPEPADEELSDHETPDDRPDADDRDGRLESETAAEVPAAEEADDGPAMGPKSSTTAPQFGRKRQRRR